jgi:glycogen(starch) synthase
MTILLVGDYPPPAGGISTHVQQLHRLLQSRGWSSAVLDIGKGATRMPGVIPAGRPLSFATRLTEHALKGSLIHLHTSGNNPKAWAVAASCGWVPPRRGPRVLTVHSGLMPTAVRTDRTLRFTARAAVRGFDALVAVSQAVAEALEELGADASRIEIHPAFIASAVIPGAPPSGFAQMRARRKTLIAMAHHPSPVYGRTVMFEALKELAGRLPGVGLCLFGPGTDDPAFEAAARSAGVEELLEPAGELEHGQVLAILEQADLFVRPTLADGDSISVREALALGVPTVASDAATRPSKVTTFRSGDREDLVRAIVAAAQKKRDGRASTRSDLPDTGEAMVRLYRRLTHEKGNGR